jgi:hypothetical protein
MAKIPVGKTIADAYGFLFHHIGPILGVTLIPAVLYGGMDYANHSFAEAHRAQVQAGDMAAIGQYLLIFLLSLLVILFASSVAAVGITQEALGLRGPTGVVSFRFGRAEWRMFLANTRYFLGSVILLGLALIVSAVAFTLAGVTLAPNTPPPVNAASVLATAVSAAAFAYVFYSLLRMAFLLPATVVAEAKGGLRRSHELSRGNFWRLLVILLALIAPIILLAVAGELVLLRAYIGAELFTPQTVGSLTDRIDEAMQNRLLPWEVFVAVLFVLASGLLNSGSAYAYRALVPGAPRTPEVSRDS